jgi:hypothetical protein
LIALRIVHHGLEQRFFYLTEYEVVEIARAIPVERREIAAQRVFCVLAERFPAGGSQFRVLFLCFLRHLVQIPEELKASQL